MLALSVTVEAAFGADLTADPSTWTWTDITSYAKRSVTVRRGRPDLASAQAAECTFALDNTDGRFTCGYPMSPYYGKWDLGTPVRIKLNPDTGATLRFQGYVASLPLAWPAGNGSYAEAPITAKGSLWRLRQGRTLRSPLYRAYATASTKPAAWWHLEDAAEATQAGSGLTSGSNTAALTKAGIIGFGATAASGAASLANLASGGTLYSDALTTGVVFANGPGWTVELAAQVSPIGAGTNTATVLRVRTTGALSYFDLLLNNAASGGVQLAYMSGGTLTTITSGVGIDDGATHSIRIVTSTNNSLQVPVSVSIDGTAVISQTILFGGNGVIRALQLNPLRGTDASYPAVGHLAVWYTGSLATQASATAGWANEVATARVTRVCGEENLPVTITGTSTVKMGAQRVAKLYDLLADCADADSAILADGMNAGLTYVSAAARYNASVALALDVNRGHVKLPVDPIRDDQRLSNNWTASRTSGSSATAADGTTASIGDYENSASVNVAADAQLPDQASWRVRLGTVSEMRVPTLPLSLTGSADLVASWLACALGGRITVANPPVQYPPGGLDLVLEYYEETFDAAVWTATLTASPFAPWRVLKVGNATLGRLQLSGSTLTVDISATAPSFQVSTSTLPLLTTKAAFPADFPMDLDIEGEQVRVTDLTGASSPQTLTVTRSINGVVKTHNSGAVVKLWKPTAVAL